MAERFVNVRFSGGQMERLEGLCAARGQSRSDVIRGLVLDAAMEPAERACIPDESELLTLLSDKARSGNVTAIKTLLERHAKGVDDSNPFSELDELDGPDVIARLAAHRRERRNGNGAA
jgi:hypothetical protein